MKVSTNELLLALRSPSSGWLAAMICALDEAFQDSAFTEHQRELVRGLIDAGGVPVPVAKAANDRLARFEETVQDLHAMFAEPAPAAAPVPARPKLTVCGGTG